MTDHIRLVRCSRFAPTLLSALVLTACNDSQIFGGSLPGSSSGGPTTPTENIAPSISGQPLTVAKVNQPYEFMPQASDADGDRLRFEIKGRPSWATFDPKTGKLYGVPPAGASGTEQQIQILVSDGLAKVALQPFELAVVDAQGTGIAELTWAPPTEYTDGTPLRGLAGYRVYYGRLPNALSETIVISDPAANTAVVRYLGVGTWYFAVTAYTSDGIESDRTQPVWKSI